jgi:hypothetical protein
MRLAVLRGPTEQALSSLLEVSSLVPVAVSTVVGG